jgi:hypothetical protein
VALALHYFGMDHVRDVPSNNVPPVFVGEDDKKAWVRDMIGNMLDEAVLDASSGKVSTPQRNVGKQAILELRPITLRNGEKETLYVYKAEEVLAPPKTDHLKSYSKLVLDLGLLYLDFEDACHVPNRDRMLRILKMMLPLMKGSNNLSKYALELQRFIIQHTAILSESHCNEVFYELSVNNKGKFNTHILADEQMEYSVHDQKKWIKHI